MAILTPGAIFLSRRLLSLVCLSVFVASARLTLNVYLSLSIPAWVCVALTVLGVPLALTTRIILEEMHHHQRAAALGARIVPRVEGCSFSNLDLVKELFKEAHDGYLGKYIDILAKKHASNIHLHQLTSYSQVPRFMGIPSTIGCSGPISL